MPGRLPAAWSSHDFAILGVVLLLALALRLPVLNWGLPPTTPQVAASDIRCSYAFDEDDILTGVSFMRPAQFDFDPRRYHWGMLHFHLLQGFLDGAEAIGYFERPWRDSYYNLTAGEFERVYKLARGLSVFFGLLGILAVYLLTLEFHSRTAAFWAAAIVGASPAHLLGSAQIRVDLTMVALVTLAAWLGLRALRAVTMRPLFGFGIVCGLAVAAKYPALLVIVPMLLVVLHSRRYALRGIVVVLGGVVMGTLLGAPYLLARWPEVWRQVSDAAAFGQPIPPRFAISPPALLWDHLENVVRFGIGPVAAALAGAGMFLLLRRRSSAAALVAAALIGSIVTLVPLKWPLLRYDLLLLPWLALAAGVALASLGRGLRVPLACAALIFPLAGSVAQIHYMRSPHPANGALNTILREVPPGTVIARIAAELPPLDRKVYPMGSNPFMDDLMASPPQWVLTADLPDVEYPRANLDLLAREYDEVGVFRSERILPWATLGESGAPHDWKYSHPAMGLYRRLAR